MASSKIEMKKIELKNAILSLETALLVDTSAMNEIVIDVIKNGQIQKFEYTLELLWKNLKANIRETGIDLSSPKETLRHAFLFSKLTDKEKEAALNMIDDRNKIAHEYKDYIMETIYPKLAQYLKLIKILAEIEIK